jgi:hypothetical protein
MAHEKWTLENKEHGWQIILPLGRFVKDFGINKLYHGCSFTIITAIRLT